MAQDNESILASILNYEKAIIFSENTGSSPEECQKKWEQKLARITGSADLNSATVPPQHSTFGMAAGKRSVSQPQTSPAKKRRLDIEAPYGVYQQHDFLPSGQVMSRRPSDVSRKTSMLPKDEEPSTPALPMNQWLASPGPFNGCDGFDQHSAFSTNTRHRPEMISVTSYEPSEYCKQKATQRRLKTDFRSHSRRASNNISLSTSFNAPSLLSASPVSAALSDSMTSQHDLLTPPTSVAMSRDTSMAGTSFCGDVEQLRLAPSMSQRSSNVDVNFDGCKFNRDPSQSTIFGPGLPATALDSRQLLSHTGGVADDEKLTEAFQRQNAEHSFFDQRSEALRRSISAISSDSITSELSNNCREQTGTSTRMLARILRPNILSNSESTVRALSTPSTHEMSRTASHESQNGRVAITKLPASERPAPNKAKCDKCNEKPEGYRGEHELRRHHTRAHGKIKTVWICLNKSPDDTLLDNCEQCQTFKKYNAYYNAAAHLRRRHFNAKPRGEKRSRKLKPEEKRGGKGGGTEPPMEELRKWMYDFEVDSQGLPLKKENFLYTSNDSSVAHWEQQLRQDEMQCLQQADLEGFGFPLSPEPDAQVANTAQNVVKAENLASHSPANPEGYHTSTSHASSDANEFGVALNSPQGKLSPASSASPLNDPTLFDSRFSDDYNFEDLMFPSPS